MLRRTLVAAAVAGALATAPATAGPTPGAPVLAPPPAGRIYHAANAGFGGAEDRVTVARIRRFERLAGERLGWAYFSDNWIGGIGFPARQIRAARAAGLVPFIRMMPRSGFRPGGPDRRYTMQSIIDGDWDGRAPGSIGLIDWCRRAAGSDGPLLVELGTEVNGDWFPWNGRWNGGRRRSGYGDPRLADGPERFRDAYRHVVDVCRAEGAANLTWFFHIDVQSSPAARWNEPSAYYPGDDYVDWIGVSAYGSLHPSYPWRSFSRRWVRARAAIRALGPKPIALLETGVREDRRRPHRKARWTRRMLRDVRTRFPEIRAVSWWNERYRDAGATIDLRIDSSRSSLRAYRRGVADPAFAGRLRFARR